MRKKGLINSVLVSAFIATLGPNCTVRDRASISEVIGKKKYMDVLYGDINTTQHLVVEGPLNRDLEQLYMYEVTPFQLFAKLAKGFGLIDLREMIKMGDYKSLVDYSLSSLTANLTNYIGKENILTFDEYMRKSKSSYNQLYNRIKASELNLVCTTFGKMFVIESQEQTMKLLQAK